MRTRRHILKRNHVRHFSPRKWCPISGTRPMNENIPLAGNPKHTTPHLSILQRIQSMFPQATRTRIMSMEMYKITRNRQRLVQSRRKTDNTPQGILSDKKIARAKSKPVFRNLAGILKTIFAMHMACNRTFMSTKIFRSHQHHTIYLEANIQMRRILELVIDVTPEIWHMPSHTQRRQ